MQYLRVQPPQHIVCYECRLYDPCLSCSSRPYRYTPLPTPALPATHHTNSHTLSRNDTHTYTQGACIPPRAVASSPRTVVSSTTHICGHVGFTRAYCIDMCAPACVWCPGSALPRASLASASSSTAGHEINKGRRVLSSADTNGGEFVTRSFPSCAALRCVRAHILPRSRCHENGR